jgi:hypothetical protein
VLICVYVLDMDLYGDLDLCGDDVMLCTAECMTCMEIWTMLRLKVMFE